MSHRQDHLPKCSADFYLRPLCVPNGNIWYSCQARGRHTLEKVVKKLCEKTSLGGKCTNHSCRASTATKMYESGIDEQLICECTGHSSVAVRGYIHTSNKQLRDVSAVLYGNKKPEATVSKPCSDEKVVKSEVNDAKEPPIKALKTEVDDTSHTMQLPRGFTLNFNFNVKE